MVSKKQAVLESIVKALIESLLEACLLCNAFAFIEPAQIHHQPNNVVSCGLSTCCHVTCGNSPLCIASPSIFFGFYPCSKGLVFYWLWLLLVEVSLALVRFWEAGIVNWMKLNALLFPGQTGSQTVSPWLNPFRGHRLHAATRRKFASIRKVPCRASFHPTPGFQILCWEPVVKVNCLIVYT